MIDPHILFAQWLYATLEGVDSGREVARLSQEHDAYRWICGGVAVNYRALNDFRSGNEALMDEVLTGNVAALVAAKKRNGGKIEDARARTTDAHARVMRMGDGAFARPTTQTLPLLNMTNFSQATGANVSPLHRDDHADAAGVAMRWLGEHHRKGWRVAFEALLDEWVPEKADDEEYLGEDLTQMLAVNAGEWLLARGEIFARGTTRSINEYLLGRDGPRLTLGQQRWIAQLREKPLRLYRVTDVRLDEGLTLVDELDSDAEPLMVRERSGSRGVGPGMLMGARVMQLDDHLELSGAIYPFTRLHEASVVSRVQSALNAGLHPQNALALAELAIARRWLAQWLEPMPIPEMRDAASGDPILLITDHYRVHDAAALAQALQARSDISGDAEHGWHRDREAGGGMMRSLAAINPGRKPERIEVFYRTQRLADEGRVWFEALAGSVVQHLTREVTDPRSTAALAGATGRASAAPALDPETMAAAMEQFLHSQYANWADEPIPALGAKTPRQAIKTSAGLERVKGLLREYEDGEAAMARRDARREISYRFLWDALGISR